MYRVEETSFHNPIDVAAFAPHTLCFLIHKYFLGATMGLTYASIPKALPPTDPHSQAVIPAQQHTHTHTHACNTHHTPTPTPPHTPTVTHTHNLGPTHPQRGTHTLTPTVAHIYLGHWLSLHLHTHTVSQSHIHTHAISYAYLGH